MRHFLLCLAGCLLALGCAAQTGKSAALKHRFDPPFWWVGMAHTQVELLLRQDAGAKWEAHLDYPGVRIVAQGQAEHPQYRYITLEIADNAQPGTLSFVMGEGPQQFTLPFTLKERRSHAQIPGGLTSADFIYLAMPDRFANGDPRNDVVDGMQETRLSRDSLFWRHGGDIQGIMDHLGYLKDLGVTALWLNPLLENDEPEASYHGYAITDHYRIDPRFGENWQFEKLSAMAHAHGIKMVMDVVYNHIGDAHHLYRELPWASWIHRHPEGYLRTSYRSPVLIDPYASQWDLNVMSNGWFDRRMPDLNQRDAHLATYLIQNSIWWIEYVGLDAFRIDTYTYSDPAFMQELMRRILLEYPQFGLFGETWVDGVAVQVYFSQNKIAQAQPSILPGVTDFQLYFAIVEALNKPMGWAEGLSRHYLTLAADYLYADPNRNVIFLDNHDLSRFYSVVGEDFRKFKMGIAWLMTMRGIPMLYYGTEILMKNFANPDGKVREDFPGGWKGDAHNKFTAEGRSEQENEAFDYVRTLARWRKTSRVVQTGKLMQFVPENGAYVYFRYTDSACVLVALNCSDRAMDLEAGRFKEILHTWTKAKDVATGKMIELGTHIHIPAWEALVWEMEP